MTYCNVVRNRRRWEIMVLPDDDQQALLQPDRLWQLLAPWVKPEQAQLERAAIYTFHSVIADGWRDRRLFLAGDACHQTPPFLGQGMCAGIRDASNLAWKLVAVLKGEVAAQASEDLLDSYEAERKPHVRALIELAVHLGNIIQTTDPVLAAERDARFKSGEPEVFELPRQVLGSAQAGGEVGQAFPQPQLADGRLLDDLLGRRHAVIGHASALQSASPETRARWLRAGATVLGQSDPHLDAWLHEHKASAVVLRPDRYIVGIARTGADLDRISQLIPVAP